MSCRTTTTPPLAVFSDSIPPEETASTFTGNFPEAAEEAAEVEVTVVAGEEVRSTEAVAGIRIRNKCPTPPREALICR